MKLKKVLYGAALVCGISSSAFAGGPTTEVADVTPSWTGLYAGADAGYIWGKATVLDVTGYNTLNHSSGYDPAGGLADVHIGYQWLFASELLLGAELQGGWNGLSGTRQHPPYIGIRTGADSVAHTDSGGFGTLLARFGILMRQSTLFFVNGGWTWTGIENYYTDTDTTGTTLSNVTKPTREGYVVGGGVEYAFTPLWSGLLTYEHYDFGTVTSSAVASGTTYNFQHALTANSVTAGVNRHIDI